MKYLVSWGPVRHVVLYARAFDTEAERKDFVITLVALGAYVGNAKSTDEGALHIHSQWRERWQQLLVAYEEANR